MGACYMEVTVIHNHIRVLGVSALFVLAVCGCMQKVANIDRDARKTGIVQYQQGNYAVAAGSFKSAVHTEPRDYKSYYYMGASYEQMQMIHEAISAYKSAWQVIDLSWQGQHDPEFRARILDAVASVVAKSDERHAELDLLENQAKDQQKAEPYYVLAKIYRYSRDADSAINYYNRAFLLEPENFTVAKEMGLYLEQLGQTRAAEMALRQAYSLNMRDEQVAGALRRLGVVPGPGVKDQRDLAGPAIPQGPLPDLTPQTTQFRNRPDVQVEPVSHEQ
jgi:Tfp pilus assembly protein PilF